MTDYVGETFRVFVSASDFDGSTALAPADIDRMTVEIRNAAGTVIVEEAEMGYSIEESLWIYIWLTTVDNMTAVDDGGTALPAGTYWAKYKLIDLDGHPSFEYKKIRLARIRF
jgi:hypothetical protein